MIAMSLASDKDILLMKLGR